MRDVVGRTERAVRRETVQEIDGVDAYGPALDEANGYLAFEPRVMISQDRSERRPEAEKIRFLRADERVLSREDVS